MEQQIVEILQRNFGTQNINKARQELCFLFKVKRSENPKCPKCNSENLSNLGSYWDSDGMTGDEYLCDDCEHEFEFNHFN